MAAHRGASGEMARGNEDENGGDQVQAGSNDSTTEEPIGQEPSHDFLAKRAEERQFTFRALFTGIAIGILIAFSNTYFGLQTGWVSGMAMPSALVGFAYFKGLRTLTSRAGDTFKYMGWGEGFSEVENVLVQAVAGSVGTMPLGCGFVGVVPALEFLLKPDELPSDPEFTITNRMAGFQISLGKLILWALGLCFFGVVFAVPLRKEVIIREKLRFPSGTATALMIGVLHGGEKTGREEDLVGKTKQRHVGEAQGDEEIRHLVNDHGHYPEGEDVNDREAAARSTKAHRDWQKQIQLLIYAFAASGVYTIVSYFVPQLHRIPILGTYLANAWLWKLNPSPAYVGQGIIMGPATTIHMFLGALLGWAVLSPIAKKEGWAPGKVSDWNTGSKGWIVWVSLAIMLADAIVSLGWLVLRPSIWFVRVYGNDIRLSVKTRRLTGRLRTLTAKSNANYHRLSSENDPLDGEPEYDAPPEHLIGVKTTFVALVLSLALCIFAVQFSFGGIINIGQTILAIVLACFLAIMGVRALGETDLNPVSGISKLTQLVFALVTPAGSRNAVSINLLAGAISEAGALQAGDLLQDLKTAHLLGASPKAQFYGQLIGSGIGAIVSACVYRLYTHVYEIPGGLFQVPTGFVWVFTARLVTGQGLPAKTAEFAIGAAVIWSCLTVLRIYGNSIRVSRQGQSGNWVDYVPGGIAVAVGMYNEPSFTLARTAGGIIAWWWTKWLRREDSTVVVLASGLILGEGLVSIINLGLASAAVPHL